MCANTLSEYGYMQHKISKIKGVHLGIEFYLFVSHGGMKRQRFHV